MPAPTIDSTQSVLGFRQFESFTFQPAATENPLRWTASGLPPGVTIETHSSLAATGVASTDVLTATGNTFANGHAVYFETLTGGTGLAINTQYFVIDESGEAFKLATNPAGAAINFTTDITAAQIRRVSSGAISGASTAAGIFAVSLRAINGDGTSAAQTFTIGILGAAGSPEDDALDLYIETTTGAVTLSDPGATTGSASRESTANLDETGLFQSKRGDKRLLRIHFRKGGNAVDLTLTALQFTAKEFQDDALFIVLNDTFEKSSGKNYFHLIADFGLNALRSALSSYNDSFVGFFEIEWRRSITFASASHTLINTTQSIPVMLALDLDQA